MDSPSPPATPDYVGAAQQQGASNVETALTQGKINNPNMYTPYGSQQVTWGGQDGQQPTVTQSLAPAQQGLLDSQNRISQGLLNTGETALGQAQNTLSKPMDLQSVQDIYDKAYKAQTARLDPQWQQNTNMQETQLRNQGLVPGSEAYDNAMRTFNQGKNDAYQQAEDSAISTMPQTYQLASAEYNQPLNTVNALRTGNQVQNPTFQQYQGSTVGQTPIMQGAQAQGQAAQNQYNVQQSAANSTNSGLMSLAGTAAAAAFF